MTATVETTNQRPANREELVSRIRDVYQEQQNAVGKKSSPSTRFGRSF